MRGRRTFAWLAGAALAAATAPSAAQSIPGQIPDPSTYQGSMELQRREQQQQQQNQPQAPQYPTPSAGYSAPAGTVRQPPAAIDWSRRPPLPPARNPLLGRWRATEIAPIAAGDQDQGLVSLLGPALAGQALQLASGVIQGSCDDLFGRGLFEFRPTTMVSVHPDGSEVVKNHVQYRADGARVVVLPQEPGSIPAVIFSFDGRDKITASPPGCPFIREGGGGASAQGASAGRILANAPAPAAANAVLTLQAGAAVPGNFLPFSGAAFYLVRQDPDAALVRAGFTGPSPVEAWFQACRTSQDRCRAGIAAMTANSLAAVHTDAAGNAVLPPVAPGRYYIVGHTAFRGGELVWHRPIVLQPGANGAFLDQTNATAG